MNKQNKILDFENILNTYNSKIPTNKLEIIKIRKWMPLFQDSSLAKTSAYFIGKLMGDGNLDKSFTCRFVGKLEDLEIIKELIIKEYSIEEKSLKINVKKAKGYSHMLQVNDSLIGRFLFSLGAPIGNKTKKDFLVPDWIIKSEECKRQFLRGIFDDELSTIKLKKGNSFREATFRMAKIEKYQKNLNEFLSQLINLIEGFRVKCSLIGKPYFESLQKDKNKTFSQCFRILGNRKNMINFYENIGFGFNQDKVEELESAIEKVKKMRR